MGAGLARQSPPFFFALLQRRARVHRSLACAWLRVHAGSLTRKIPHTVAANNARAEKHQRGQEQHALDSSMHAVIASAGDESPGGDGTMSGGGLRAPMEPGANDPWRPLSSHLQPTWAPQPERKYGDHGGGDHACAPAPVDLAALSAASRTAEDPKRALVHALKNDVSRLLVRLERLDELLSA